MLAIILTAVLTTLGTIGVTFWKYHLDRDRDEVERNRHATYLAARVVCILDQFVILCCDAVTDQGIYDDRGEREFEVASPTELTFPDDIDWKSINPDLMYRSLLLQNEIDAANKAVSFIWFVAGTAPDYDEVFEERAYRFGKIGAEALTLATEFRKTYGLRPLNYGEWHPKPVLERAFIKRDKLQSEGGEIARSLLANKKTAEDAASDDAS